MIFIQISENTFNKSILNYYGKTNLTTKLKNKRK